MPGCKVTVVTAGPWLIYHVKSAKASGLLPTECGEPSRGIVLDVVESEATDTAAACSAEETAEETAEESAGMCHVNLRVIENDISHSSFANF